VTNILIVEDVPGLRQHARKIIEQVVPAPLQITEATNGSEGLKLANSLDLDLIVMDISMPEMSGIKAAQQIWHNKPTCRILFWSQYHREAYVRELGRVVPDEAIHGYALKSETDDKFAEAVKSVLFEGNPYIDPLVRGVQARLATKDSSLTDVEFETLLDIAVGLTDRAIARRRHISVRGVQNRLSMLLQKLLHGEDAHLRETADMEVFNARTRIIFECLRRGLIDTDELSSLESELTEWLEDEFDFERKK
jgi:DNA-binding NarL/FixJ family response regulator